MSDFAFTAEDRAALHRFRGAAKSLSRTSEWWAAEMKNLASGTTRSDEAAAACLGNGGQWPRMTENVTNAISDFVAARAEVDRRAKGWPTGGDGEDVRDKLHRILSGKGAKPHTPPDWVREMAADLDAELPGDAA